MKGRKDELLRKRGALDPNSDVEQAHQPISESADPPRAFRSKLHDDIKRQEREAKELHKKELAERQERNERMRKYARNVKDLYMPSKRSSSQRPPALNSDLEGVGGVEEPTAREERKDFKAVSGIDGANGYDQVPKKEIRTKRR